MAIKATSLNNDYQNHGHAFKLIANTLKTMMKKFSN